jgi:hypothetical protein
MHCSLLLSSRGEADVTASSIAADSHPASAITATTGRFFDQDGFPYALPSSMRPRLLLHAETRFGHVEHLGPALLDVFEKYPILTLDLSTMFDSTATRSPEDTALWVGCRCGYICVCVCLCL